MLWTMASPSPVPESFVVKKGAKIRGIWSSGIPTPESQNAISIGGAEGQTFGPPLPEAVPGGERYRVHTRRDPPAGIASTAFKIWLRNTCFRSSRSPGIVGFSQLNSGFIVI